MGTYIVPNLPKMADAVADDDVTLPRGNVKKFFLFYTFSTL